MELELLPYSLSWKKIKYLRVNDWFEPANLSQAEYYRIDQWKLEIHLCFYVLLLKDHKIAVHDVLNCSRFGWWAVDICLAIKI